MENTVICTYAVPYPYICHTCTSVSVYLSHMYFRIRIYVADVLQYPYICHMYFRIRIFVTDVLPYPYICHICTSVSVYLSHMYFRIHIFVADVLPYPYICRTCTPISVYLSHMYFRIRIFVAHARDTLAREIFCLLFFYILATSMVILGEPD